MAKAASLTLEELVAQRIASRKRQVLKNLSPKVAAAAAKLALAYNHHLPSESILTVAFPLHPSLRSHHALYPYSLPSPSRLTLTLPSPTHTSIFTVASPSPIHPHCRITISHPHSLPSPSILTVASPSPSMPTLTLSFITPFSHITSSTVMHAHSQSTLQFSLSSPLSISFHLWCFGIALILSTFREVIADSSEVPPVPCDCCRHRGTEKKKLRWKPKETLIKTDIFKVYPKECWPDRLDRAKFDRDHGWHANNYATFTEEDALAEDDEE
ncbi:MAG: hypothetical protein Q9228_005528 [Teloschistes exilis]